MHQLRASRYTHEILFRCIQLAVGEMASGVCGRRKVEEWMLERGRATFAPQAPPTRHQPDLPTNQLDLLATVPAICTYTPVGIRIIASFNFLFLVNVLLSI